MGNKNIVINGKPYQNVSNIKVRDVNGQDMHSFRNTDDATIESKDIPVGKVGYGKDGKVIGTYIPPTGEIDGGINFYDQYGAWLTSYKLEDLPLSALPEIPALDGAGADQYDFAWSMTLEEVNALTEETDIGVDVTAKEGAKTYVIPNHFGFGGGSGNFNMYFYGGDENATALVDFGNGNTKNVSITANTIQAVSLSMSTFTENSYVPITVEKLSGGDFYLGGNYNSGSQNFVTSYISYQTKEIRIGSGIKGITQGFLGTSGCEKIILHNKLEAIGTVASLFASCYRLKSLNIPKSIKSVSSGIASDCPQLETLFIHEGLEETGTILNNCYSVKKLVLPKTYKKLTSTYIVGGARRLEKLKLPKTPIENTKTLEIVYQAQALQYMGDFSNFTNKENINRFAYQCSCIKELTIPEGVIEIGGNFAYQCYALETITLPSTLKKISSLASDAKGLKQIIMKSPEPPTLASTASFTFKPTLYVPKGSLEAYATATNLSAWAENMVEY